MHVNHKDQDMNSPLLFIKRQKPLLAQGACSSLAGISLGGLGLSHTLGQELRVLVLRGNAFVSFILVFVD